MVLKVELAQIRPKLGDIEFNLSKHVEIIETSSADCVVFPELSLTGYVLRDLVYEVYRDLKKASQKIADKAKCAIFGTIDEVMPGVLRNSAGVAIEGKLDFVYKFFLPTYGLFEERRYFQPGNPLKDLKVFSYKGFKFGVAICEDAWHPEPIEALALLGAEVVFIPSASPMRRLSTRLAIEDQWEALLKAHSIMHGIWSAFVNAVGSQEEEYFWGGSMIVNPLGVVVARAQKFEEARLTSLIDREDIRRARYFSSFRDHNRDFHRAMWNI
ncbi:MAG: amidohydrolase [Candidatus Aramenus sp.]|nr:amidohydrolase [Candidatus Aramenus sp.]